MIRQPRETGPDGRDHDLDHITAVDRLDREPEHGQYDSRYYSHWTDAPSSASLHPHFSPKQDPHPTTEKDQSGVP